MYIESATSPNGNGGKSRIAAYVAARSLWDDTVSADEHLADWCRVAFGPARDAETPMLFTQIRQPATSYLAIPEVSSERRKYVPIGFLTPNVIASSKLYVVPDATLWMFGVLTSIVHMAWMRIVCGRLKSDYSYSPAVYNNFPWPVADSDQHLQAGEITARIGAH